MVLNYSYASFRLTDATYFILGKYHVYYPARKGCYKHALIKDAINTFIM